MSISNQPKKLNIITIGGISKILANFPKNSNLWALETNSNNLSALPEFVQKIQFGNGDGSGGNPEFAKSLFDPKQVEPLFDCDLLILIAGLGGGTGSGITPEIAKLAKEKGILTKIIAFSPRKIDNTFKSAKATLETFQKLSLPITVIDNQEIFDKLPETANFFDFLKTADFGARDTTKTLESILESQDIDFGDLKRIFGYNGLCFSTTLKGNDFDSVLNDLKKTMNSEQISTAKGFLMSIKVDQNSFSKKQEQILTGIFDESKTAKIDFKGCIVKSNIPTKENDSEKKILFEISIFLTGIGTQDLTDKDYFETNQRKIDQDKADYKSEVNSQNAKRK